MTNPFFAPSTLPFGLPPFADITDDDYRPAFDRGFEEHLAEITADRREPGCLRPSRTRCIPLERRRPDSRRGCRRVFFNKSSADSNDFTNQLEEDIAPLLAAHADAIRLNPRLYERISVAARPTRPPWASTPSPFT